MRYITVLLLLSLSLSSCSMLQEVARDYNPDYGRMEVRYNNSWGHYNYYYYRPVRYDWRWTYPRIVNKSNTYSCRTIVRSKTRRGHVSNQRETRSTNRRNNSQK